jgi:small-conductance mechanosensitive channel
MLLSLRRLALWATLLAGAPVALAAQRTAAPKPAPGAADTARVARDTTVHAPIGVPVVVRGDTVLFVPTRLGAFTAEERAAAVAQRVSRLSRAGIDSLVLAPSETSTDIVAGETVLMTVTDADAAAVGRPRAVLAAEDAAALAAELKRVSLRATIRTVVLGAFWTLVATGVLAVLLAGLGRVYPRTYAALESRRRRLPTLRIQKLEILSADTLANFLLGAHRLLRIVVVAVLLYLYLPLVLGFFPWTQRLSGSLFSYVTTPLLSVGRGLINYLPNVFFIAVIVLVTRYALKLVHLVFGAIERGTLTFGAFERDWAEPTYKIVRFLIIAFAFVVLFPYLPGSRSEAFKGVTLFLGVLFSLGSSSAIANIVAGVVLTYTRAFNVGDRVKIGDTTGDVVTKTLLVTRVRTIKNVDITIPNAMVLGTHIQNYTAMAKADGLILHTGVSIGYDAPWKQVHELLIAAALATPGVLKRPEPFVFQTGLDDFYVSYELNAYTDQPAVMAHTYSLLHANIQDKFNEGGVEILSPHYAQLRDGNMVTIPANYLPKDYAQPPFRVQQVGGKEGA